MKDTNLFVRALETGREVSANNIIFYRHNVYCIYPAMLISPKQILLSGAETNVIIIVFEVVHAPT